MIDITFRIDLTVKFCTLDINILRRIVVGDDRKGFTTGILRIEPETDAVWNTGLVSSYLVSPGQTGCRPLAAQHVPGRHLPYIFIAYQSFHRIPVSPVADGACPFLCKPGSSQPVV